MVFDISHLRKIRAQLNLTQHAFSKEVGISQSMIAKIESGKLDPALSKVKKIEDAIERLSNHHEKKASEIMNSNIIFVGKNDLIKDVIKKLSLHKISQVPVIEDNAAIGLISESIIISSLQDKITQNKVEELMSDAPPLIPINATLSTITALLKDYSLLLVGDKGVIKGIVTKADIIKNL